MIDTLILLALAALAIIGWIVGMFRPQAQLWVRLIGPIAVLWLIYYFFVSLSRSSPQLVSGTLEAGRITVGFMVGGVWALMARPKRPATDHDHQQDGRLA